MMYKVEYNYEEDTKPHTRFYSALNAETAKAMFFATCEDGSLSGCRVNVVNVCKIKEDSQECEEDSCKCKH